MVVFLVVWDAVRLGVGSHKVGKGLWRRQLRWLDEEGRSPLHLAARAAAVKSTSLLIEVKADVNEVPQTEGNVELLILKGTEAPEIN